MPSISKIQLRVRSNAPVCRNCLRLELEGTGIPAVAPGQFVHLGVPGKFLRRPISVHDSSSEGIVLIYKTVGEGTRILSGMGEGECVDVLLPLGNGFDTSQCSHRALLLGGGLGSAPLYLLGRQLLAEGRDVSVIMCFNTAADVCLAEEYRELGIEPVIVTLDGSAGLKGMVTDVELPEHDCFYTCGPLPMMRAVCKMLDTPGQVSMEERMGCGAGFCYGCSIQTHSGPARVCADGPVFNKRDIIWQET
ncbi:MAG: dihydroorotate dehydrogenase electron transfer subunit [Bacteroidales bacterium]|nr:dihydroorotate dehydrogenase electron transfer subunit [Bacteroidales bacterium]